MEEITTLSGLENLRPAWQDLWARTPSSTPFQSPDLLIPWWRHIGEGELLTLSVWEGKGRLAGVLPLYVYERPEDGGRILFPLGIATLDYLDALAAPGRRMEAMRTAFAHLAARPGRWQFIDWPQLPQRAVVLEAPVPDSWDDSVERSEACPILHLPPRVEGLRGVIRSRMLQNLRTYRRRAEAAGDLRWDCADEGNLEELLDALFRLHRARWSARGEAGVLASTQVQAFHRAALPGLLRSGMLRLHAMRLGEQIVAVLYALADRPGRPDRRVYFYLAGFDPAYEHLSPGTLLIGHAIEDAIRLGATTFDFLRGRERYKYLWGARDEPTFRRRLRPTGGDLEG